MARFTDFSEGGPEFRKYHDGHPMWATAAEVDAAKAHDQHAIGKAAEVIKGALRALCDRGMSYSVAVDKLRRLQLTPDELERLAKKTKNKTTVNIVQPEPRLAEPDEDGEDSPDEQLEKLGEAVRRVNPTFSKAQAVVWVAENIDVGRELVRLSKRRSISRYGEQAAGHFDKAESPVSQTLPSGVEDVGRRPVEPVSRRPF